jgi:multiple sugar transport system substrate-binding protein
MRKFRLMLPVLLIVATMVLAACPSPEPAPAPEPAAPVVEEPAVQEPVAEPTATTAPEPTPAPEPTAAPAETTEKTQVRWFVGLGTGTDPAQQEIQQQVVKEFNESQDKIELVLEVVPYAAARDTLSTQIASGNPPDIVGPVGWGGSNAFYGQWLDIAPLVESSKYDTSVFNEALVKFYQTEEGQVGLPFAVFPAAMFFQKEMFDEAGLNYPPTKYGDKYIMPDGSEVEWNWETVAEIAKILTVDANGNDATSPEFDKTQIVQYGYVPQYQHPNHTGAFFGAGSLVADDGKTAEVPEAWKAAWKWLYDGYWGEQPFIPTGPVVQSPEFGAGNPFNSAKVAMGNTHMWYTCCIADAGESWDFGILPSNNGQVNSRVDADTYRILKGTKNPEAAFEVLSYLIGPASLKLLETYGGMPARTADQAAWLETKGEQFPFVANWDVMIQGLNYPDVPSAEGYMPNFNEAWDRVNTFGNLMQNEAALDLDKEIETLQSDLQTIFDKAE